MQASTALGAATAVAELRVRIAAVIRASASVRSAGSQAIIVSARAKDLHPPRLLTRTWHDIK